VVREAAGTFHLVGDEAVERMELALKVCEVFELDSSLLRQSEPPAEALFPAAIPVDSSLENEATKAALGIGPQSLESILRAFKLDLETGEIQPITRPA
jgi:dTDP-4-dehydrorhamnose reductase